MEPLERIEAAVLTPGGSYLVADGKKKRVYRYDAQFAYKGPFPDNRDREVTRLLLDGEGAVVLLDRAQKIVQVLDETGKVIRTAGPRGAGFELRKPVDVAVDPFRNVYVAEEEGAVHVISPQGQLLTTLTSAEMKKPRAVTLDPSGAVLVYDERLQRVLRFK
jgi:sugar lactone lactonase YvrE